MKTVSKLKLSNLLQAHNLACQFPILSELYKLQVAFAAKLNMFNLVPSQKYLGIIAPL